MSLPSEPLALISRPKLAVLRHVGVLLPNGHVVHCTPNRGEHMSSVEEFAAGQDVRIEQTIPREQYALTLARIAAAMATPAMYDLVNNNCEMFAARVTGSSPASPQLYGVLFLAAAILVLYIAAA